MQAEIKQDLIEFIADEMWRKIKNKPGQEVPKNMTVWRNCQHCAPLKTMSIAELIEVASKVNDG